MPAICISTAGKLSLREDSLPSALFREPCQRPHAAPIQRL